MNAERRIVGIESGRTFIRGRLIQQGNNGQVFNAHEGSQPFALKVPIWEPEGLKASRLRDEGALQSTFNHPHITRVELTDEMFEGTRGEFVPFLVTPLAETDLRRTLGRGRLRTDDALRIGMHTADALAAVHERGLVFIDIIPANVLIPQKKPGEMTALLNDFGAVREQNTLALTASDRRRIDVPESEGGHYFFVSDQYKWAINIALPALTHIPAHQVHLHGYPIPVATLVPPEQRSASTDAMAEVIVRASSRNHLDRYPSMAELHDDLSTKIAHAAEQEAKERRSFP